MISGVSRKAAELIISRALVMLRSNTLPSRPSRPCLTFAFVFATAEKGCGLVVFEGVAVILALRGRSLTGHVLLLLLLLLLM